MPDERSEAVDDVPREQQAGVAAVGKLDGILAIDLVRDVDEPPGVADAESPGEDAQIDQVVLRSAREVRRFRFQESM